MYVCGGGEEKRKVRGYMSGGETKKKGNKKEKRNGECGIRVWWEKKGEWKKKEEKKKGKN